MRIFLSCQQSLRRHDVPAYAFWEYYFRHALREAGHEIVETPDVDWAEGLGAMTSESRAAWLNFTWSRTVDFARAEHSRRPVALFLSYLFPEQVQPTAVRAIHDLGIPTVNFFCDNVREFREVPDAFQEFTAHWVPEAKARGMYQKSALDFIYAPMPVWVPPSYRTTPSGEKPGTTFLGSCDPLRAELLQQAVTRGLEVEIFGAGWTESAAASDTAPGSKTQKLRNQFDFARRHGVTGLMRKIAGKVSPITVSPRALPTANPPIYGDDYFLATRQREVVVGVNRCPSFRHSRKNPLRYSRLRDIEAPMLGACYLTEAAPGLEDLYEIGSEIETYRDAAELVSKANELRANPSRRASLRKNGQRRALAHHTIARSLEKISGHLGIG